MINKKGFALCFVKTTFQQNDHKYVFLIAGLGSTYDENNLLTSVTLVPYINVQELAVEKNAYKFPTGM